MKHRRKAWNIIAYCIAAALLAFYLVMLYLSFHPDVSDDYRMRYLEEGYFWEEHGEEQK